MDTATVIELIGLVLLPLALGIIGWLLTGWKHTVEELRKADAWTDQNVERLRQETTKWELEATEKFAQRGEMRDEFNSLEATMVRLETKVDQLINRLIPAALPPRQE